MTSPAVLVYEDDPAAALAQAVGALAGGGCVIYPTDTVYGLLARPEQAAAYHSIFRLKGRSPDQPLALLAHPDCPAVPALADSLESEPELARGFAAGSLTLVVEDWDPPGVPEAARRIQPGSVGLRCPADARTRELLAACGGLLWGTSVNRAGQQPAATAEGVRAWLAETTGAAVRLAVVSQQPLSGVPSTVVVRQAGGGLRRLR